MPFYHTLGRIPRKRHIAFRKPDGGLYHEQLVGIERLRDFPKHRRRDTGISHLYHRFAVMGQRLQVFPLFRVQSHI